jgi:prepilin-type N-terminal cleavage/methylation domain-containing protein
VRIPRHPTLAVERSSARPPAAASQSAIRNLRSKGGFTLLEVTLALAILAVTFTALSTLQVRNLTLTAEDRVLTQATLAARDLLAQIQLGMISPRDGEGDFGSDHLGWRWILRVRDIGVKNLAGLEMTLFEGQDPAKGTVFWFLVYQGEEK